MSSDRNREERSTRKAAQEHLRHAVSCAKAQQWDEAIQSYDRALALVPDHDPALIGKGVALAQLGRSQQALACFDTVLGRSAQSAEAWFDKAVVLFKLNRWEEARRCFQQAQQLGNPKASEAIARCDKRMTRQTVESANAQVDRDRLVDRGIELEDAGRTDEAMQCYEQALAMDPHCVAAWLNKGRLLRVQGDNETALACYDQGLAIKDDYLPLWVNKGVALRDLGRLEEADACYDRALQLDSDDATVWSNKGNVLSALEQPEKALECFSQATRIAPAYDLAWISMGATLGGALGQHQEALACFERVLQREPDNVKALFNKGAALHSLGRLEESLEVRQRALRLDPDQPQEWCHCGYTAFQLNDFDFAAVCFDFSLDSNPDQPDIWYDKGYALSQLAGRLEEAEACFQNAKRLGHNQADEAIAWCRERLAHRGDVASSQTPAVGVLQETSTVQPSAVLPDGSDSRLIFAKGEYVSHLEEAIREVDNKDWEEAGKALEQFAAHKGGRFTIWQMMRDRDRLWTVVRKLARSGEQRQVLDNLRLVCAVCGRTLVRFSYVQPEDPVFTERYFPAKRWRCSDRGHLRKPNGDAASAITTLYEDAIGLEFPDGDAQLRQAKAAYQESHETLEDRKQLSEKARASGVPPQQIRSSQRLCEHYLDEQMKRYSALERTARKRLEQPDAAPVALDKHTGISTVGEERWWYSAMEVGDTDNERRALWCGIGGLILAFITFFSSCTPFFVCTIPCFGMAVILLAMIGVIPVLKVGDDKTLGFWLCLASAGLVLLSLLPAAVVLYSIANRQEAEIQRNEQELRALGLDPDSGGQVSPVVSSGQPVPASLTKGMYVQARKRDGWYLAEIDKVYSHGSNSRRTERVSWVWGKL